MFLIGCRRSWNYVDNYDHESNRTFSFFMLRLLFVQSKMLKVPSKSASVSVLTWSSHKNRLLCCFSGSGSAADIEFYCERAIKETIDWSHYCLISPAAALSLPAEWVYSETGDNKRALLHLSSSPSLHIPLFSKSSSLPPPSFFLSRQLFYVFFKSLWGYLS